MSTEWDEMASGWDRHETRLYAECAFESWNRKVAPLISDLANSRVLDFGCGTGLLAVKMALRCGRIVAIDTSVGMIEVLKRKIADHRIRNVTPLVAPFDASTSAVLPELAGKFNLITASSVCSFLADYESTVCDLSLALAPGGLFAQWDWSSEMPVGRIRGAFEVAGLIEVGIEEAFSMTINNESMPVVVGIASRP